MKGRAGQAWVPWQVFCSHAPSQAPGAPASRVTPFETSNLTRASNSSADPSACCRFESRHGPQIRAKPGWSLMGLERGGGLIFAGAQLRSQSTTSIILLEQSPKIPGDWHISPSYGYRRPCSGRTISSPRFAPSISSAFRHRCQRGKHPPRQEIASRTAPVSISKWVVRRRVGDPHSAWQCSEGQGGRSALCGVPPLGDFVHLQ